MHIHLLFSACQPSMPPVMTILTCGSVATLYDTTPLLTASMVDLRNSSIATSTCSREAVVCSHARSQASKQP